MRVALLWACAGLGAFLYGAGQGPPAPDPMVAAARDFLSSLDAGQRERAAIPFDDAERRNWSFVPRERRGLPLQDMSDRQRQAAQALMRSALSSSGYLKATGIMELEGVLRDIENNPGRNPGLYCISVFGEPGAAAWGWRVEGHHLSLNFSSVGGLGVATTPAFLGANPEQVLAGPRAGWRVLGQEEDLGRALVRSLDEEQRRQAVLSAEAPAEILYGPGHEPDLEHPSGLPWSAMNADQHELLWKLVQEYADNLRPDLARARMARISPGYADDLRFAWAGGMEPGQGHYYRITGKTFVIEYDNTQNGANHAHACWRDRDGDFGEDLLRQHLQQDHGVGAPK